MINLDNIHSLTDFKRNASNDVDQLRELKLATLQQDLQIGLDQLANGQYTDYTEDSLNEFFDQINCEGRQELGL